VSFSDRVDRAQRRFPWLGFPIAVTYKFADDQANYLAALLAYYGFLSIFPLLLLATTVLSYVLVGHPGLRDTLLNSALHQFPVVGEELTTPHQLGGGVTGVVVGVLGAIYGASRVVQAVQNAMNVAWQVPRNERPNPIKSRLKSLVLLGILGGAVLGTSVITALGPGLGWFPYLVLSFCVNAVVFGLVFERATARPLTWRDVLPGALVAAFCWELLQSFGSVYVRHVTTSSGTNGVFAVVLGLIAFLYITAGMVLFCVEINVVRVEHLYPRSLLTPFTDDVDLTRGDKEVYDGAAQATKAKGFQEVDVSFHKDTSDS
jgi:YihY family inner membrane protein